MSLMLPIIYTLVLNSTENSTSIGDLNRSIGISFDTFKSSEAYNNLTMFEST